MSRPLISTVTGILRFALLLLAGVAPLAIAAAPGEREAFDLHLRGQEAPSLPPVVLPESLQTGRFAQRVDHDGLLPAATFAQRYWYDSQYASGPDAPVLYHICGEGNAEEAYFLNDNAIAWARELGAHLVYLEHRYYGSSQPFADLANEHLRYLTLHNVIEDLATFQRAFARQQGWNGNQWIAIGGSYSATLAAIYRQLHPELVVGALAASAPMISGVGHEAGSSWDLSRLRSLDVTNEARAWAYQSCTEFGYWQAQGAWRGAQLDLPSSWLCQQAFGDIRHFDAAAYNRAYNAPYLAGGARAPSRILFTYGSRDVWTDTGLATQTVRNPNITVHMIEGAGHHEDLNAPRRSDSAAIQQARELFLTKARQWLDADDVDDE